MNEKVVKYRYSIIQFSCVAARNGKTVKLWRLSCIEDMGKRGIGMKLNNITDIDKFFQVVDSCKGKVELISSEGERLNLKSKLNQYASMAKIFSAKDADKLEIVASYPADTEKLMSFMMNG